MRHTWGGYRVVLVSVSPRWKELLVQIGLEPGTRSSRMEEETREKKPDIVVMELSRQKTESVAPGRPIGATVVGADTVVSVRSKILGKSETSMRAYEILEKIWGRTCQIHIGVTVLLCQGEDRYRGVTLAEHMDVHICPITCGEVKEYTQRGEPLDKARAYEIQGRFTAYMKGIDGDYADVVRLSVERLYREIKRLLENREDD